MSPPGLEKVKAFPHMSYITVYPSENNIKIAKPASCQCEALGIK